jgi:hypothetical protein
MGTAFRGAVGQVGAVGGGAAIAPDLARDRRGGAIDAPRNLRVGEAVGDPLRDLLAFLLGEPASRHRPTSFVRLDAVSIAFTRHSLQRTSIALLRYVRIGCNDFLADSSSDLTGVQQACCEICEGNVAFT